jgi:stearoyl-CoA desaturase (delta-9 desaturase)
MYWWELDLTWLMLLGLEKLGLVWDLKVYPEKVYAEATAQKKGV